MIEVGHREARHQGADLALRAAFTGLALASTATFKPALAQQATTAVPVTAAPSASAPASTQSEIDLLRSQIAALSARLSAIENAQATAPAPAAATAAPGTATPSAPELSPVPATKAADKGNIALSAKVPITVTGLFQVQNRSYLSQQKSYPRLADTFRLRRGELKFSGTFTPRISALLMIDPAKSQNGAATNSILQEVQISYLLHKGGHGTHFVDVGQFKIPVGYESLQSSASLQFAERALIFAQRDPYGGGYGDVRDSGVQLRGNSGAISYRLGVFNGFGDRQNQLAASDPKAVIGWLSFKPRGITGLEFGASGGRGGTANSTAVGGPRVNRDLFNLFAAYRQRKLRLSAEYLSGKARLLDNTGLREISGYYGAAGYFIRPKLEAALRYDSFNSDRTLSNATVRELTLGLNYTIKVNTKIQTNLIRHDGSAAAAVAGLRPDSTELRTQFQVAF